MFADVWPVKYAKLGKRSPGNGRSHAYESRNGMGNPPAAATALDGADGATAVDAADRKNGKWHRVGFGGVRGMLHPDKVFCPACETRHIAPSRLRLTNRHGRYFIMPVKALIWALRIWCISAPARISTLRRRTNSAFVRPGSIAEQAASQWKTTDRMRLCRPSIRCQRCFLPQAGCNGL